MAADWGVRPACWLWRRLARSPVFREWLTRVEDQRLFLLELDWRGPDAAPVDDEFFKDTIRGRGLQPPRLPNHLVAEVDGKKVRLDRGLHGDPIRKENRSGQAFPYSRVHSCTDPSLRELLEKAEPKTVHLCREGATCPSEDAYVMHFRKYTGVDAKSLLDLHEDEAIGSPFAAAGRAAIFYLRKRLSTVIRRFLDVGCCCLRKKSRRRKTGPIQAPLSHRNPQVEEEVWEPCMAEAVAWMDTKNKYCCLQLKGTCSDRRAAEPTPLLIEDGNASDTRGWPRNAGGAPLVMLCRYHSLECKNGRHGLVCTEPGCWHLGEAEPGGKRRCVKHGRRAALVATNHGQKSGTSGPTGKVGTAEAGSPGGQPSEPLAKSAPPLTMAEPSGEPEPAPMGALPPPGGKDADNPAPKPQLAHAPLQVPRTSKDTEGRHYLVRIYSPDTPPGEARRHTVARGLGRGSADVIHGGRDWAEIWLPGLEVSVAIPLWALGPWSLATEGRLAQGCPPFRCPGNR